MKDDHRAGLVGAWASLKLSLLEKYLRAYCTALKGKQFHLVYIDAFAGNPLAEIRTRAQTVDWSEISLFETYTPDDAEAQQRFILGSPARAVSLSPGFHEFHFFDMDANRAASLTEMSAGRHNVHVSVGNSNPLVRSLALRLYDRNIRGVAFLDPYGAHLEWSTVEALAKTTRMEVIINFPHMMAINRMIPRDGNVPKAASDQLDRCFGTDAWRDCAFHPKNDLFGSAGVEKGLRTAQRLTDLYCGRLAAIFPFVSRPFLIRNTRKAPLYNLIWAGPNKVGHDIITSIFERGERHRRPAQGRLF